MYMNIPNPARRTIATINKTVADLDRLAFWFSFAVQVIFLGVYGVQIALNFTDLVYCVLYCAFEAISIAIFVVFLVRRYNVAVKKSAQVKTAKHALMFVKFGVQASLILLNVVKIVMEGSNPLDIILTVISILALAATVIIEVATWLFDVYSRLIVQSVKLDIEEVTARFGGNNLLGTLADMIEGVERPVVLPNHEDALSQDIEKLTDDYWASRPPVEKKATPPMDPKEKRKNIIRLSTALLFRRGKGKDEND